MNVLGAAKVTMEVWRDRGGHLSSEAGSLSYHHCVGMLNQMAKGEFSYGKMCRWLGWMQAACVASGAATLETMKDINRSFADGEGPATEGEA